MKLWLLPLVCLWFWFQGPAALLNPMPAALSLSGPLALAQLPLASVRPTLPDVQLIQTAIPDGDQAAEPIRSLFYRQPWRFGPETFSRAWQDLERLPAQLQAFWGQLPETDSFALGLLLGGLLLLLGVFWLDRRFQLLPARWIRILPAAWPFWLRRLAKVLLVVMGRMALLLLLLFGVHMFWGSFADEQRYFPLVVNALWVLLLYRGCQTLLYQALLQEKAHFFPDVPVPKARRLYWRLNGFALFSAGFWTLILSLGQLGVGEDLLDLLHFAFAGLFFTFVASLITRKQDIFSLFPEIDEPVYERFMALFRRFYLYVTGFSLALGLLWIAGYRQLAGLLFLRSWVLVGMVLAVRLGHRLIRQLLVHYLDGSAAGPEQAARPSSQLVNHIVQALALLEILLLVHGVLQLLGIRTALLQLLAQPMASIGGKSVISPLSLINGGLTLLLFWLVARILISFLEERIFPARFEVGVEQMIEVTVFYSLMALGVLMALNIVGIDLSVFAIFAGALAFGIGFGLQGIAKNFASGLILIFTGLVKKGDYITVGGQTGYIQDVSWKKVHLRTPDHVDLIIPTVDLVESTIVNWSFSGKDVR
ncbi:MAG: mechanosensitive ion channel family protein, partial [Candidatus Sericytochromatia bacterium]